MTASHQSNHFDGTQKHQTSIQGARMTDDMVWVPSTFLECCPVSWWNHGLETIAGVGVVACLHLWLRSLASPSHAKVITRHSKKPWWADQARDKCPLLNLGLAGFRLLSHEVARCRWTVLEILSQVWLLGGVQRKNNLQRWGTIKKSARQLQPCRVPRLRLAELDMSWTNGQTLNFVDTPGELAFKGSRAQQLSAEFRTHFLEKAAVVRELWVGKPPH